MKSLSRLRAQIETIDARIVGLLNERLALSTRIGQVKKRTGCGSFFPDREEYLLRLLAEKSRGPLAVPHLRAIYREIFSSSRAEQEPLTVGTLGAPVSDSLLAARCRFGAGEVYRPHRTAAALLQAARTGKIDVAVLPAAQLLRALARDDKALGPLRVRGEIPAEGGTEPFYLLGKEAVPAEATPETTQLWLLRVPAAAAAKAARWCRAHGVTGVARAPGLFLFQTDGAEARPLAATLRPAFGPGARLRLLGAFATPHLRHGR
jgi:chorismate mutase